MFSVGSVLSIALQFISLLAIIYSAIKVINRNEDEWRQREQRLLNIEHKLSELGRDVTELRKIQTEMAAVSVQMVDLMNEFKRIRDRLDRFLDVKTGAQQ